MSETTSETLSGQIDEFGVAAVRELIQMIEQTDITELLIERGDSKLHVKRGNVDTQHHPPALPSVPLALSVPPMTPAGQPIHHIPQHVAYATPQPAAAPQYGAAHSETNPAEADIPDGHIIQSPMVGTFYSASSPKDPAFVNEGDEVHIGDTIGIVEAMKMMNEIESEVHGRVVRILVKNEQPVEYGQPLVVITPL